MPDYHSLTDCGAYVPTWALKVETPKRGDWFKVPGCYPRSCINRSKLRVCQEWDGPPPLGKPLRFLPRNAWCGPVHEVRVKEYNSFVTGQGFWTDCPPW